MNNYFPHDSNARNSDKLIPLRARFGAEGYGIYFMLIERLREESSYMSIKDYNMLAFDLRVDAGKVKSVIEDFGLFAFTEDGKCFYSESLMRRMKVKDEKSEKARQSAKSRWNKSERKANAPKSECERIANAPKSDAIKVKESKDNIKLSNSPPIRTREQELLDRFDKFAGEILKGGSEVWIESMKKNHHIEDMREAFIQFRQYSIQSVLMEKIEDERNFKQFFNWKVNEFLTDKNNEHNRNNRLGIKGGNTGKGYTIPACGLVKGKRE